MEGRFKGWLSSKSFGFIEAHDDGPDVFLHKSQVPDPSLLVPGAILEFEAEETDKGRSVVRLSSVLAYEKHAPPDPHPDFPERREGVVKLWSDRGFGFVTPRDRTRDAFVHAGTLEIQIGENYLTPGDVVLFDTKRGEKGPEAYNIETIAWEPTGNALTDFANMGSPSWLADLAALAEPEDDWNYRKNPSPEPFPILRSYMRYTLQRLLEMSDGVCYSTDESQAAFNTGLVTPHQEEIYALFARNQKAGREKWRLRGFMKASDKEFVNSFGSNPPPLANYFDDPSVLLYDRRCPLYVNIDHVLEHIERFPEHLRNNEYVARQLLLSAEAQTQKRVYRNYKAAIPQYYRESGRAGTVQLLLPICLEDPTKADLALVVSKNEAGNAYRGSTVLTLDMAYNNARLLARPDTEWLQP